MRLFIILAIVAVIIIYLRRHKQKKTPPVAVSDDGMHLLLKDNIRFYHDLDAAQQASFRQRAQQFLDRVTITPVGNLVLRDLDKLYVAASAIIPIFSFPGWAYNNLNEVLIYPGAFTKDFKGHPEESNVLGMVGEGAMNRMMILSIQSLRDGFRKEGQSNTGIHEFVHLLDKADGATDGIPEAMLPPELMASWVKYTHQAIREIRQNGSDINEYAGTNEAEFFAVISEYFFQQPEKLKDRHPRLFGMLEQIYRTEPVTAS